MAFQVSPAVNVSEIDLTTIVPQVSSTTGGFAGVFRWGPLNDLTLVDSEDNLVRLFGKPNSTTAISFFTAASFLAYGNKLRLARVANETDAKNATAEATTGSGTAGTGLLIKNDAHYENSYSGGQGNVGLWAGRYAGALGNGVKVSLCHKTGFSKTLAGTLSSSGTAVTGSSTAFTTELAVGSILISAGEERTVTAIASNTGLTLNAAFTVDLSSATITAKWEYYQDFEFAPGTSDYASERSSANDEIHVVVVDGTGQWTGIIGTVLEKYSFLSLASDAKKEDGSSNYYAEVINRVSKYIRWMDHLGAGTNWGTAANSVTYTAVAKPATYTLAGGSDGSAAVSADYIRGYNLLADPENVDVSLIMGGNANTTVASHIIQNICEVRKDCIALLSPEAADAINNPDGEAEDIIEFRNTLPSSSYAVLDSGWKYMYDRHNDAYRWVPLNGDVAGLCVRTDTLLHPWYPPAGLNRGGIKNCIKLAWNPTKAFRDDLFANGINPVVGFPGQGFVLFGDKTLLSKPSAFDAINVRRLFIVLEKAISTMAKFTLFELNNEDTRARFKNTVEPYLRDVKARKGVYDYQVVCDETNNTGEVIDRNEFIGDIYIKPARSIRFIQLNFVAVRTGVAFSEVIGSF